MSQTALHAASLRAPNQPRAATGWNAFSGDRLLVSIADRLAPWAKEKAARLGAHASDEATQELARLANKHTPELKTHDRFGNRIDWVELHPAWHELMALAFGHEGIRSPGRRASPAATSRGACSHTSGTRSRTASGRPLGMTYAAFPGSRSRSSEAGARRSSRPATTSARCPIAPRAARPSATP